MILLGYEDFICAVQTQMQQKLGEGVHLQLHKVMKNNSVVMDALSISESESGIAPTIYLNDFYQDYAKGRPLPDILDQIAQLYEKNRVRGPVNADFYADYEKVRDRLACRLVNREKNRELLKQIPHRPFLDLEIVLYYCFTDEELGNGTILVYLSHLKTWNVSTDEAFAQARANTLRLQPPEFVNMHRILERYRTERKEEEETGEQTESAGERSMYVLTNKGSYFGAAGILFDSVLQGIAAQLKEDFWVLPSSIHECIIVPYSMPITEEELRQMVREINRSEVDEEDYLSDEVYLYRAAMHRLSA